jgi:uncharacterized membrane protein
MNRIEKKIRIKARADKVFEFLSDPQRMPEWATDVTRVAILAGRGKGMRYRKFFSSGRFFFSAVTRESFYDYEVTEISREKLSWRSLSGPRSRESFRLKPTNGETELTYSLEYTLPLLGSFIDSSRVIEHRVKKSLEALKKILE